MAHTVTANGNCKAGKASQGAEAAGTMIELEGVATNNLKSLSVAFPLGQISVVTGVSGSGKTSLVFDSLYAESYRRYVESLSSFARQYLQTTAKPKIERVRHLPPAVAVRQTQASHSSRSTVGTATELVDLLRVLFTHLAKVECYNCHGPVRHDFPATVAAAATRLYGGQKILVCAPLQRWGKVAAKDLRSQLEAQGFTRLCTALGETIKIAAAKAADLKGAAVVIDRLSLAVAADGEEPSSRLLESLSLAFKVGRGKLWLKTAADERASADSAASARVPADSAAGARVLADGAAGERLLYESFSEGLDCPRCGIEYEEPSAALLSFNHPLGACAHCQGFGFAGSLAWDKIIPDQDASLATAGVAAWNFGKFKEYYAWAKASAKRRTLAFEKPFRLYDAADWQWLKLGEGREFDGIEGFFTYLESKKYKAHYRIHAARFRRYVLCPVCHGDRLKPVALACKLRGLNLAEACRLSISELTDWTAQLAAAAAGVSGAPAAIDAVTPDASTQALLPIPAVSAAQTGLMGVEEVVLEMTARLNYLRQIGVAYLALDRPARTLSGGELQRINMARCLGSALTDTLFCLDEPTAGLHARDSANLLTVIRELCDQGNTVVMVEHERQLLAAADYLVEIGPKAGHEGGNVVYAGLPAAAPSMRAKSAVPASVATAATAAAAWRFIELKGARTHNLQNIDVRFPTGKLTAVCGVSGSGKTSLIQHTLYPLVAQALKQKAAGWDGGGPGDDAALASGVGPAAVLASHSGIMLVSQGALGRSSRSNIATYLGLMDEIRRLLGAEPLAKKLGLTAGSFSFNNSAERGGGRCEHCQGLGTVVEDLSFLGDMAVTCPTCNGRRFNDAVLAVELRGRNLLGILALSVAEARAFFYDVPRIAAVCDTIIGMGMGYITLGQGTSSFSGGEAQRLKLLSLMEDVRKVPKPSAKTPAERPSALASKVGRTSAKTGDGRPMILIFDEPTTGLSDLDVANLLVQLRGLAARGHTLIVVEHHLQVLKAADWLIEIGPEAAARGGRLVYEGPPAGIKAVADSVTRPFICAPAGAI